MKKVIAISLLLFLFVSISNAQVGKMSVQPDVVIALPIGDFSDFANVGFGATGTFLYRVIDQLDLTGTVGFLTFGTKTPSLPAGTPSGSSIDASGSFRTIPVMFGARYYFVKGAVMPYGAAELGLHFTSSSDIDITYNNGFQTVKQTVPGSSDSNFGFGFGGGAVFQANSNLMLNGELKFNIISTSGNSSNYLSVQGGVLFSLN